MCANKFLLCIHTTFCIQVIYSFKLTYILVKSSEKCMVVCFWRCFDKSGPFSQIWSYIYNIYYHTDAIGVCSSMYLRL